MEVSPQTSPQNFNSRTMELLNEMSTSNRDEAMKMFESQQINPSEHMLFIIERMVSLHYKFLKRNNIFLWQHKRTAIKHKTEHEPDDASEIKSSKLDLTKMMVSRTCLIVLFLLEIMPLYSI